MRDRERQAGHVYHLATMKYQLGQERLRRLMEREERERWRQEVKDFKRMAKNEKVLQQWFFLVLHGFYIPKEDGEEDSSDDWTTDSEEEDDNL